VVLPENILTNKKLISYIFHCMKVTKAGRNTSVLNWLCVFTSPSINKKGIKQHHQRGRRPKIIEPPKIFLSIQSADIYFTHKNYRLCKNTYM